MYHCEMELEKRYVSVDIEATGLTPGKYSMIALGACIVGDVDTQFYRELQPLNMNFNRNGTIIGCLGLRCLEPYKINPSYNPKNESFDPFLALEVLAKEGQEPSIVMDDFRDWILDSTKGYKPVMAAAPIIFDGMFINWYFDNFCKYENPFGHSAEDMNSMYRGKERNINVHMKQLGLRPEELPHNALEDAIIQAKEFEVVLKSIKQ